MPDQPLRIGVLGAANIARAFTAGCAPSTEVRVMAVASRGLDKAEAFAAETGIPNAHGSYEALPGRERARAEVLRLRARARRLPISTIGEGPVASKPVAGRPGIESRHNVVPADDAVLGREGSGVGVGDALELACPDQPLEDPPVSWSVTAPGMSAAMQSMRISTR